LPSHIVGIISLVVLAGAILARYALHLVHAWRWIYVVCAVLALYLNSFVAVVQSFLKVPVLKALAPTQKEPPFLVAQLAVMAIFVVLGVLSVKRFHVERVAAA
jgi:MFS family permease